MEKAHLILKAIFNPTTCPECGELDALITGYDPKQATCRFCGISGIALDWWIHSID